ncbi:MAG: hypothetical protein NWF00_06145 [Candidatus Bathyarchaeota archaeon]|nr:hypothetical protein [Candidatus Bathyarchaeota archaeon]
MKNKTATVAVTTSLFLVSLLAGIQAVEAEASEPLISLSLAMDSPKVNATYTNVMPLVFSVQIQYKDYNRTVPLGLAVWYQIDQQPEVILGDYQYHNMYLDISKLSNGTHKLTIYAQMNYYIRDNIDAIPFNSTVIPNKQELPPTYFSVSNVPPSIHILSPQNKTYTSPNVTLNYVFNDPASINTPYSQESYSLDNQANQTMWVTNGTLRNLTNGPHSLTIYGKSGSIETSDTVFFTVDTTSPPPSPSPTIPELPQTTLTVALLVVTLLGAVALKRSRFKQ